MRKLFLLLLILCSNFSHAICVNVNASDGVMGTVVCYSDSQTTFTPPTQTESTLPTFNFNGMTVPISAPPITSSSGITFIAPQIAPPAISNGMDWNLQPTFITLPQISMPQIPTLNAPTTMSQIPQFQGAPTLDFGAHAQAVQGMQVFAAMAAASQKIAADAAVQELESTRKAIEDWRNSNIQQLDVQINSEFARLDEDLKESGAASESSNHGALSENGLLKPDLISNPEMRILSEELKLETGASTEEGRKVRKVINRAFALAEQPQNPYRDDTLKTAVVMSVGADLAYSAGQREEAQRLIHAAGITLDIAIGFIPIASSINDATQIIFGLMTGRDYNGNIMTSADYTLRAAGIVIGLLPAAATLRFGKVAIDQAGLITAKWIRRLPVDKILEVTRAAGMILANPVGAIGHGVSAIIRYRQVFQDSERFNAMISAIRPYNSFLTKAGHALTKHPEALGYKNYEAMRKILRTDAQINAAAEKLVEKALLEGKRFNNIHVSLNRAEVVDLAFPNGIAVRFYAETNEFITFVQGIK